MRLRKWGEALFVQMLVLWAMLFPFVRALSSQTNPEQPPTYFGITARSCRVDGVVDNQNNVNGVVVVVSLHYQYPRPFEWQQRIRMFRLEDYDKAEDFCLDWHKKVLKQMRVARKKGGGPLSKRTLTAFK